jgi:hypothetical protein
LGGYLKKEREMRNLSLTEVSKSTKVKEHLLKALEENQYEFLPSATYVKGFLLAYARALGLDPNDILLRYDRALQMRSSGGPEVEPNHAISTNSRLVWVIGGIVGIGLISAYLLFLHRSSPRGSVPVKPPVEAFPHPVPSSPVSVATTPVEEKPFSIQVKAVEETWVRLRIDGEPEREMILKPGEAVTHQGMKRMELLVGNAGGIELVHEGNARERFGKSGEVVTLIVTPEGVVAKKHERPRTQESPPPSKPSP